MAVLFGLCFATTTHAETYSFGVLSQRSAVLTAQYWNPILDYVKRKTGIDLQLKLARTAPESNDATERGEYPLAIARLKTAIKQAERLQFLGGRIFDTNNYYGRGDNVIELKAATVIPGAFTSEKVIGRTFEIDGSPSSGTIKAFHGGEQENITVMIVMEYCNNGCLQVRRHASYR